MQVTKKLFISSVIYQKTAAVIQTRLVLEDEKGNVLAQMANRNALVPHAGFEQTYTAAEIEQAVRDATQIEFRQETVTREVTTKRKNAAGEIESSTVEQEEQIMAPHTIPLFPELVEDPTIVIAWE